MKHAYKLLTLLLLLSNLAAFGQFINLGNPGLRVGIGFSPGQMPRYPLSFPNVVGDKISLWNTDPSSTSAPHYGLGVQGFRLQLFTPTTSDNIVFGIGNSANFTENVRFTGNGRVGIGTNNPDSPLTLKPAIGGIGLDHTSPDGNVRVGTYADNNGAYIQTHSSHPLRFSTNNSDAQMTLSTDGNLGIGIISPQATLHVTGSVRLATGNQGLGKILTSDAIGNATWEKQGYGATQISIGTNNTNYNLASGATPTLTGTTVLDDDSRYNGGTYSVNSSGYYLINGVLLGYQSSATQTQNFIRYRIQVYVNGVSARESVSGFYNARVDLGSATTDYTYMHPAVLNTLVKCDTGDSIVLKLFAPSISGDPILRLIEPAQLTTTKL